MGDSSPMAQWPPPEDLARVITKRPGMYLGGDSYERALGFLHGLASLATMQRPPAPDADAAGDAGFSAGTPSELLDRISALRRDPGASDSEAIRALEPLLVDVLVALQGSDRA